MSIVGRYYEDGVRIGFEEATVDCLEQRRLADPNAVGPDRRQGRQVTNNADGAGAAPDNCRDFLVDFVRGPFAGIPTKLGPKPSAEPALSIARRTSEDYRASPVDVFRYRSEEIGLERMNKI